MRGEGVVRRGQLGRALGVGGLAAALLLREPDPRPRRHVGLAQPVLASARRLALRRTVPAVPSRRLLLLVLAEVRLVLALLGERALARVLLGARVALGGLPLQLGRLRLVRVRVRVRARARVRARVMVRVRVRVRVGLGLALVLGLGLG